MKQTLIYFTLMAAFLTSCGSGGKDLEIISRAQNEITQEYLEGLEANGKTLLTFNNTTNFNVTLDLSDGDDYNTAGCGDNSVCFFEYTMGLELAQLHVKNASNSTDDFAWMGPCSVTSTSVPHTCILNTGVQLTITVVEE